VKICSGKRKKLAPNSFEGWKCGWKLVVSTLEISASEANIRLVGMPGSSTLLDLIGG
jgi:hypothetical protein